MAEEDNKKEIKDIGNSLSNALKKSFSVFTKSQVKGTTGFLKSAEDLVEENKAKQESFAKSLTSIRDAIHAAFPKVIETIKTSLAPPTASAPSDSTPEVIKESNSSLASMIVTIKDTSSKITNSIQTGFDKSVNWLEKVDSSSETESTTETKTIVDRLKETASSTINSLGSVFTKQSDEVEDSIKEQTNVAQDMAAAEEEGKATEEVLQVEGDREKATQSAEHMQILREIRDSLKGSFGAVSKDKKKGGLLAGLLGGIGAGIGAIAKGIAKIGVGFGKGMIALGVGIAGFMLALGTVSILLGLMGADGSGLAKLIQGFFGAFTMETAGMMGGIILAAGLLAKFKVSPLAFAKQMTALGAGITGFFAGILLGDALGQLGTMIGLDGKSIGKLMTNFFGGLTPSAAAGLGVVVTIAGLLAGFKVDATQFAKQMTGVGAGIAGFMAGLLLGDAAAKLGAMAGLDGGSITKLMDNFFGGMTPAAQSGLGIVVSIAGLLTAFKVDALQFAKQMTGVGAGIAGFAGGLLLGDAAAKLGAMAGLDGGSITTLVNNFFGGMTPAAVAGLTTITTIAGLLTAFKVDALLFAKQMTGVGAGIAGFGAGLLLGDAAAKLGAMAGLDGKNLSKLMSNFFGAMTPEIAAGMGVVITLAGIAAKLSIPATQIALGMTGIGAGIAGFGLGIIMGDGAAKLGAMAGLDGSSLAKLMGNFMSAFDGIGLVALGALIVAGAALGASIGGVPAVIAGMTAIGAGIAAFMIPMVAADWIASFGTGENLKLLLTNIGGAIGGFLGGIGKGIADTMKDVDGAKLKELGEGIEGVGKGMIAAAAGMTVGLIGGLMSGIGSFFGVESPIDRIIAISKDKSIDAARLKVLGEGIGPLGEGLKAFSGFKIEGGFIGDSDLETFIKIIAKLGDSKVKIDTVQIQKIADGIGPLGTAMAGFSGVEMDKLDEIDHFFEALNAKAIGKMASPEQLQNAAKGIDPLGKAIKTFSGIDMDALTGGWGEDNLGKFFAGVGSAVEEVKDPGKLNAVASGITVLGNALQTFKGIDSDKMNFTPFFESLEIGDPERMKKNLDMLGWTAPKITATAVEGTDVNSGQVGGLVTETGPWVLHGTKKEPEFILDQQATQVFMKAATLLTGSQMLEQERAGGGGPPVVINQVDNSQANPVISNQATQIKASESPHARESTKAMLDQAYAMG